MGVFITFPLHVAASSASTPFTKCLFSPCFLSYCCMNPVLCPLLSSLPLSNSVSVKKNKKIPSPPLPVIFLVTLCSSLFYSLPSSCRASQFSFLSSLSHSKVAASLCTQLCPAEALACISCVEMNVMVLDISLNTHKNTELFT